MSQRFFRIPSAAVYESTRLSLDAAFAHVNAQTCVTPAASAPRDSLGRLVLAVQAEFCEYLAVAEVLPQLLASGAVEEIDAAAYFACLGE